MSSEHIVNQHQIQNQRKEQMDEAAALKHISKDLKQTNNETIVKPIANDTLDATNIQKLLSHQSDQTKQAILKKSYDYILQNNPINEGLQEELNKEIDHYFKTPSSDQTSVSDEYKEATSRKTDDPARRQALTKGASNTIQSKNNQKRNKQVQANPNRHTEEETDDPLLNHKKLYETTTKKHNNNPPRNSPSSTQSITPATRCQRICKISF